jgi:hypothetical protein
MIRVNVASAIIEAAELELRLPVLSLCPHLGCFWSIATTTDTHLRTLPDACAQFAAVSPAELPAVARLIFPIRAAYELLHCYMHAHVRLNAACDAREKSERN